MRTGKAPHGTRAQTAGVAFEALKISVRDLNGGPRPPATHDAAQVLFLMLMHSMTGSCLQCETPSGAAASSHRYVLCCQ